MEALGRSFAFSSRRPNLQISGHSEIAHVINLERPPGPVYRKDYQYQSCQLAVGKVSKCTGWSITDS